MIAGFLARHVAIIGWGLLLGTIATAPCAGSAPGLGQPDAGDQSGDWLLPERDYAGTRHSPLTQLDRTNAHRLREVCRFAFEDTGRTGDNPVVRDGILYATAGDATAAIDAATCAPRWQHVWKGAQQGRLRPYFKSRGVALHDGLLVRGTSEGVLLALDAATGAVRWTRTVASPGRFEFITTAPLAVDDRVILGFGISEYAVKGWIGAFRLSDGEPLWRFDAIPADDHPAAATWTDRETRETGGGGIWVTPSLDRATGTLYAAIGNPAPDFFGDRRVGANLYTASLVALDLQTGALRWHRQFVPHDLHDWDLTVAGPLYVAPGSGEARLATGGKDGLLRALRRADGEPRFETPVTTRLNADAAPTVEGVHVCPGVLGGMQWSRPALAPSSGLLLVPAVDWCGTYRKAAQLRHIRGQLHLGGSFSFDPRESARGWLSAIDAETGALRWRHGTHQPLLAAVTTTASGLVLTGELDGHLLLLDERDGSVLLRTDTGVPLHAGAITYSVADQQFVALAGGSATSFWRAPTAPATIVVFGLPERRP